MAELRSELRDYETALEAAERSLEFAPGGFRSNRLYASCLYGLALESEDKVVVRAFMEEALQAYLKAARLNPLEGNIWLDLALTTRWLSRLNNDPARLKKAKEYLERALSLDPNNGRYLYAMVSLDLEMPDGEGGVGFYPPAGGEHPGFL